MLVTSEVEKPDPPADGAPAENAGSRPFLWQPALYPLEYGWYVFLSSLDLLFTWMILRVGGREVNAIADWIIRNHDLRGLVLYKFALVIIVVLVCEIVGRHRPVTGLKLARWAIVLSAFPTVVGGVHLLRAALGVRGF